MYMILCLCYKMWAIPTGTSSVLKKNQVKSPSPESRVSKICSLPPIESDRYSGRDSAVLRRVVAETPAVSQDCMAILQYAACSVAALTHAPLHAVPRAPCLAPLHALPCRVAAPNGRIVAKRRAPSPAPSACPAPLPSHPVCIAIQTAFLIPFSL